MRKAVWLDGVHIIGLVHRVTDETEMDPSLRSGECYFQFSVVTCVRVKGVCGPRHDLDILTFKEKRNLLNSSLPGCSMNIRKS